MVIRDKLGREIWRNDNIASLYHVNLSGVNLRLADLSYCEMTGADLRCATITSSDFAKSKMSGANLAGANLADSCFDRADLRGADLRGADLRGARFIKANISFAKIDGANLTRASLFGATMDDVDISVATTCDTVDKNGVVINNKDWLLRGLSERYKSEKKKQSYLDEYLAVRKELWATLEDLLRVVHLVGMESEAGKRCHDRMKAIYKALGDGPTT